MRLPSNQVKVAKLVLWSCLLVWMVFFLSLSMVIANRAATLGPQYFGTATTGQVLSFIFPVWVVFTALLTAIGIMKWSVKKLGAKTGEVEEPKNV